MLDALIEITGLAERGHFQRDGIGDSHGPGKIVFDFDDHVGILLVAEGLAVTVVSLIVIARRGDEGVGVRFEVEPKE